MDVQSESTFLTEVVGILNEHGFDGVSRCVEILINEAMRIERNNALKAGPYERSENRKGYANGFKPKTVRSRIGNLTFEVPQVRGDVSFYPSALERGIRSERALKVAIGEMYVNGISTRRVTKVVEEMCGLQISSSDVSRASALLDEELNKWRNRPLGTIKYLILDARYEKVRIDGSVVSAAVLIATGVQPDGHRSVLGVSVSLSEAEVHWRSFLTSLMERGMHGVVCVTADDHSGLTAALNAVLPGVKRQRCQFHLQQNAGHYVPKVSMREEVAASIRAVFNAPDKTEANRLLQQAIVKYKKKASQLAEWMDINIPQGLTVFDLPEKVRKKLRTTNGVERLNRELARRTKIAGLFPNTDSLLRLSSALLMEISEEWETGKAYIKL
ncbi:MAG: IS256 family transposase [Fibrobacter sp.]|nr:IS256 family transposase [Fibrobacter sp.]HON10690.1 IS256 family transposase [Chitinispirillaceae bacterium]